MRLFQRKYGWVLEQDLNRNFLINLTSFCSFVLCVGVCFFFSFLSGLFDWIMLVFFIYTVSSNWFLVLLLYLFFVMLCKSKIKLNF